MGIFIHYALHAECPEEELAARLRHLRPRLRKRPGVKVGKLRRLDPAFHRGYLRLLPEHVYLGMIPRPVPDG